MAVVEECLFNVLIISPSELWHATAGGWQWVEYLWNTVLSFWGSEIYRSNQMLAHLLKTSLQYLIYC